MPMIQAGPSQPVKGSYVMKPQIVPENGLIDAWIRTDTFKHDLYSREHKVHVEEWGHGLLGEFSAEQIEQGTYWSNPAVGKSGYYMHIKCQVPAQYAGRKILVYA
jgi:hypothetical protein